MKHQKSFFAGLVMAIAASMPAAASEEIHKGLNVNNGKEAVTACDVIPLFCAGTQSNGGGKEPESPKKLDG